MDIRQDRQSIAHRVFQQLQTWVTENDDHELTRNSIPIECLARNGESMVSTGRLILFWAHDDPFLFSAAKWHMSCLVCWTHHGTRQ